MRERMPEVTGWFVILAPFAILGVDLLVQELFGYEATITAVVRRWNESPGWRRWPELIYWVAVLVLGFHLWRDWP